MHAVICGAGAIGASVAYELSARDVRVTVIDACGVACAASGKSGGFLARDWCDGTPLEALARRSFTLHSQIATQDGADWGFRRLQTFAGTIEATGRGPRPTNMKWLAEGVTIAGRLGSEDTTAQVRPARFTEGRLRAAERNGATMRIGEVTRIHHGAGRVTGVSVGDTIVPADVVVVAMGPWSHLARAWLPSPAVGGLKGHSMVFRTGDVIPPHALFLECRDQDGVRCSPEVFPRADGTTYVCAISSDAPTPRNPASVVPDAGAIERLAALCLAISPALTRDAVMASQACFRPISADGLPLIGPVRGVRGAFIATGHGVWGILNAPATGEALAQLIVDGASSLDLSAFGPSRFDRSPREAVRG